MLFKDVKHGLLKHDWELPLRTPRGDNKATLPSACKRVSTFETSQSAARIALGISLVQCKRLQRISVRRLFRDLSCVFFGRHSSSKHAQVLIFLELDSKYSSMSLCTRSIGASSLIGFIWPFYEYLVLQGSVSNHEPIFQLQR